VFTESLSINGSACHSVIQSILSRIRGLHDLEDGFWIWWSDLLDFYTTGYNSLTDALSSYSSLNWPDCHSTVTHCDSSLVHIVVLITCLHGPHRKYFPFVLLHHVAIEWTASKTLFPRIPGGFTSPLPRDGLPSVAACTYVAGVLTQPLPNNESIRHNKALYDM
jgi:hypothetical protein